MKIGILRETKNPPDRRVPLTPDHCRELLARHNDLSIVVQPCKDRAFADNEYLSAGIEINEDISGCDILLGVKEVKIETLIDDKTYLFFSHTAKEQAHNRELLRVILKKKIRLIDYEYLTTDDNIRVVAFGRWAGIVGAYNGLMAYGIRNKKFHLKPATECNGSKELFLEVSGVQPERQKILITGGGRVASGAMETLKAAGIRQVGSKEFLNSKFSDSVFTQIDPENYVKRKDGEFFDLQHFFSHPTEYESTFLPYTRVTNILIACHFWDPHSPVFFTKNDLQNEDFRIKIIADISCDIPGPIPSTLRASTIESPFYGYNPLTGKESDPWTKENITVMAVDNLPGELPRDASSDFGGKLLNEVIPYLLKDKQSKIIERATIAANGKLAENYSYLNSFVQGGF